MIWFFYNIIAFVGLLIALPGFVKRAWQRGGVAKGFSTRLGMFSEVQSAEIAERPRTWIHAVSVGEMYVALRIAEELRARDSESACFITTTTTTGREIGLRELHAADVLSYFPVDLPGVMRRVLRIVKPKSIMLVELELWPNLIRLAAARGIPVMLVNGRITEKSARAYRWVGLFFRAGIKHVSKLCVQTGADRDRLVGLGAEPSKIEVMGAAKYDAVCVDAEARAEGRALLARAGIGGDDPVILGGSTWPGEESALLDAFLSLRADLPTLKLVVAPRHVERAAAIAADILGRGEPVLLRSSLGEGDVGSCAILLIDTTGELRSLYSCATVIFVGKSLTASGGQSIIEPAIFGKPILVGPNTENFAGVMDDFREADAVLEVADAATLESELRSLLQSGEKRRDYGRRAGELVARKKGVVAATVDELFRIIDASGTSET